MKSWMRWAALAAVPGLVVAAAFGSAEARGAAEPQANVVTVVATDFAFEAPDEIPAGLTTLRLENRGQTLHHVQLVRLDEGKTAGEYLDALRAGGPPPAWAVEVGGPNAPDPGADANATSVLQPGSYLLLCFVDIPGGVPHIMKGMVRPLKVTGPAPAAPVAEPAPDVVMKLHDYSFELSKPLAAGTQVIRVENAAQQPHEVELIRLAPEKTAGDLMAWMQNMQGPPPASAIGGVAGMASGEHAFFTADLAAGDYVLICFVPDARDGKPHLAHGMVRQITVE